MGDGFDVVRQRMENSSLIQEGTNPKDPGKDTEKEVKDVKDLLPEPKDLLRSHSGEPGEPGEPGRIQSSGPLVTNLTEMLVTEPELAPAFPYADTKLRPEAPPFTPECVSPNPESYGEPDTDNSCFVNVDLKLPNQEKEVFPEIELSAVINEPKEYQEIENVRLKPFGITSTPDLEKHIPNIEIPELQVEEDSVVAVRPTDSIASETRETSIAGRERVRILSSAFFFGNKTQIIVLVASIVVCVILVIFVLI